jgi:hypothetical protein
MDAIEGTGEDILDGMGVNAALIAVVRQSSAGEQAFREAIDFLAAEDKLSLFPLPNFLQACPSTLRCLFSWNTRHMSTWRFFVFSDSIALISRVVQDGEKSGEWKKAANRDSASDRKGEATAK